MMDQRPSADEVCSSTQSLAWITPSGRTHWLRDGTTHSDWAHTHLSLLSGAKRLKFGPHVAQDKLVQGGWLRVTSVNTIEVTSLDSLDQRAWDAWSEIAASCSGRRGYDPESSILIGHGRDYTKMPMAEVIETYCSKEAQEKFWGTVMGESLVSRIVRMTLLEDVRKRGNKFCAYVDDKLTKAEKERNPKKYKGKKVGSVQRTPSGKIRMKARACYASKKKANNAMAAAMMESSATSAVRSVIREMILEDLKGFQSRTKDIDYMANLDDPTFEDPRQGSLVNKPKAIDVKRAWAAEADHKFMDSIVKIHWTGGLDWEKKLRNFLNLSGKNEISTSGYLPGSNKFSSSWGTVGVIVKGRTTLASNDMNTISSGYHGQVAPETLKKYASSGVPKRPLSFRGPEAWGGGSSKYILDRDSFDPYESRRSEFIVDNWKPVGIIVDIIDFLGNVQFPSVSAEPIIRYAEVVLELGLPVYDWEMKEIPREKIEAALRGSGGRL